MCDAYGPTWAPAAGAKPTGLRQEAALALLRTADRVRRFLSRRLEEHDLTFQQYNVLRILRGAGPEGLCRNELRDRMVTRMPDMTRLLDRMEEAGLVSRTRDDDDRICRPSAADDSKHRAQPEPTTES